MFSLVMHVLKLYNFIHTYIDEVLIFWSYALTQSVALKRNTHSSTCTWYVYMYMHMQALYMFISSCIL